MTDRTPPTRHVWARGKEWIVLLDEDSDPRAPIWCCALADPDRGAFIERDEIVAAGPVRGGEVSKCAPSEARGKENVTAHEVMDRLKSAYGWEPGDLLEFLVAQPRAIVEDALVELLAAEELRAAVEKENT
jgi:hypothetical protein